jgi:hypothetical protein
MMIMGSNKYIIEGKLQIKIEWKELNEADKNEWSLHNSVCKTEIYECESWIEWLSVAMI